MYKIVISDNHICFLKCKIHIISRSSNKTQSGKVFKQQINNVLTFYFPHGWSIYYVLRFHTLSLTII